MFELTILNFKLNQSGSNQRSRKAFNQIENPLSLGCDGAKTFQLDCLESIFHLQAAVNSIKSGQKKSAQKNP